MFDRVAYLCPTTGTDVCVWTALEQQRAMMNERTIVVRPPFAANKRRAQYQSINQEPMDKSNGTVLRKLHRVPPSPPKCSRLGRPVDWRRCIIDASTDCRHRYESWFAINNWIWRRYFGLMRATVQGKIDASIATMGTPTDGWPFNF